MPLTIDATKCVDHDPTLMFPVASFMMVTGVSALPDQAAADEFYTRYLMYCLVFDVKEGDERMTHAQVSAYIGCWANVSTYTPTQYAKRVSTWAREESVRIMKLEQRALKGE